MPQNYSTFNVPSFERQKRYDFNTPKNFQEIYRELTKISEEIDQCRQNNI